MRMIGAIWEVLRFEGKTGVPCVADALATDFAAVKAITSIKLY